MAAKLAKPKSDVIIVYGDGSFGLNGFEFEAMARQKIGSCMRVMTFLKPIILGVPSASQSVKLSRKLTIIGMSVSPINPTKEGSRKI